MRIRTPFTSTNPEQRKRLSCGSWLVHTSHWHPTYGTPVEVPLPNIVIFISAYYTFSAKIRILYLLRHASLTIFSIIHCLEVND